MLKDVLEVLASTPEKLRREVSTMTPREMKTRPAPDKWSVQEILAHLDDVEEHGMRARVAAMIEQDEPVLLPFDQERRAVEMRYNRKDPRRTLTRFARQRQVNQLRNTLREFYPGALAAFEDLDSPDAIAILERAPTPNLGRALSQAKIASALRRRGRARNLETKALSIQSHLRQPQLEAPALVAQAYGHSVAASVAVIRQLNQQIAALEQELATSFETHPDAEIYLSLPGLGRVLGARALAEFGDDRTRFAHPKARKNYAGMAPITKASGTRKVVLARVARNRRLADACYRWAFSALTTSDGARRRYDSLRARGQTHHQALRALANRLVGILHGCLAKRDTYREDVAWQPTFEVAA